MVGKKFTVDNLSGAEYLASIYGTERDKVNCYFYYRVGACRFGEKCTRQHIKPVYSRTVLLKNLYKNPAFTGDAESVNRVENYTREQQEHFDEFYEEVIAEMLERYGIVEDMIVCNNTGEHMLGNVYVRFEREDDARRAVEDLNNRWFNGQPIEAELSPVDDLTKSLCRQNGVNSRCPKGAYCNFLHLRVLTDEADRRIQKIFEQYYDRRFADA